jgi:hypothetical protein
MAKIKVIKANQRNTGDFNKSPFIVKQETKTAAETVKTWISDYKAAKVEMTKAIATTMLFG